MYKIGEMMKMSNEELNKIAMQKNKIGNATKEAYLAQEIIWQRRFYTGISFEDNYTGIKDVEEQELFEEYEASYIYHFDNDKW